MPKADSTKSGFSGLIDTIETDLKAAWTGLVSEVETVGEEILQAAWNDVGKPILTSIGPTLLADAGAICKAVVANLGAGAPLSTVMTTVLNTAMEMGKHEVLTIEGNLLTAIASLHIGLAANPPTATDAPVSGGKAPAGATD